jgi:beta-glucanase (GH16 family)
MPFADQGGMRPLVATAVACILLVPGTAFAGKSSKAAHSASARTVTVSHSVSDSAVYTASVSFKRPARKANRVKLQVENAKSRKVTIRPSRSRKRMTVKIDVRVSDGALSLSAVGATSKPSLRVALRKKTVSKPQPSKPAPATPTALHAPTLPVPQNMIWADEFNGAANSSPSSANWSMDTGGHGWGNNELQSFTSRTQNVATNGAGQLSVTARKERYTGSDKYTREYTSGRLQTKGKFSMTYGRLEARVRVPAGKGLWSCVWAMGDDIWTAGWPTAGEMDILEVLGDNPSTGYGSLHGPIGTTQSSWGKSTPFTMAGSLADSYHDFGIIWTADSVEWTVDGMAYARVDRSSLPAGARWVFDHGFHPILSLAVGGNWPGSPDASTQFPATMSVDWIRAYK